MSTPINNAYNQAKTVVKLEMIANQATGEVFRIMDENYIENDMELYATVSAITLKLYGAFYTHAKKTGDQDRVEFSIKETIRVLNGMLKK